jgi:hypothetical protein
VNRAVDVDSFQFSLAKVFELASICYGLALVGVTALSVRAAYLKRLRRSRGTVIALQWLLVLLALHVLCGPSAIGAHSNQFAAIGPVRETRLSPNELLGAVRVTFDLQPTSMSFDLPWHFCSVAENGLKCAYFAAETYDPRHSDGSGANASFEAGMDKEARYARVWIEQQSPARIVVRVRYALTNSRLQIAHDDLPTASPYNHGKGDWGEERFTIYPDGVYARHMTIHTGLAAMSQPFGFYREPPNVVHEFMETVVIGSTGHVPTDDLDTTPTLTLFKMFGNQPGKVYAEGLRRDIDYKLPTGPPADFGEFRDANIMLVHTKSQYKPFTIGLPYGVAVMPYGWEENRAFPFTTWTGYPEPSIGYIAAIGHMVNWWHYRRTESTIEQVYLHGLTSNASPHRDLLPLAWSWISPPELQLPGVALSPNGSTGQYKAFTYDQTQRAYVIPRETVGPDSLRFILRAVYDDQHLRGTMWLVNPAFVIPQWNDARTDIELTLDGVTLVRGADYRVGMETSESGSTLVIWLNKTVDLTATEDHQVTINIAPAATTSQSK